MSSGHTYLTVIIFNILQIFFLYPSIHCSDYRLLGEEFNYSEK